MILIAILIVIAIRISTLLVTCWVKSQLPLNPIEDSCRKIISIIL